jgi:tetratricopeptide (TPR) repeat protein
VFSLAASAPTGPLRFSRPGRLLIQLLNHDWLLRVLALRNDSAVDLAQIREVYEVAEDLLRNDPHYWLQRGSLETEEGRIDLAKNFLDQALGLAPEDLFIRTEWAYMTLKRAAHSAGDPEALDQARVAFEELLDIISRQGGANSKPFHVYGSQGLSWAKRAPIDTSARIQLLDELRATVDRGLHHHPGNNELLVLARDLQTEQLMIAVPQQDSSAIP